MIAHGRCQEIPGRPRDADNDDNFVYLKPKRQISTMIRLISGYRFIHSAGYDSGYTMRFELYLWMDRWSDLIPLSNREAGRKQRLVYGQVFMSKCTVSRPLLWSFRAPPNRAGTGTEPQAFFRHRQPGLLWVRGGGGLPTGTFCRRHH